MDDDVPESQPEAPNRGHQRCPRMAHEDQRDDSDLNEDRQRPDPEHVGGNCVTTAPKVIGVVRHDGQSEDRGRDAKLTIRTRTGRGSPIEMLGLHGSYFGHLVLRDHQRAVGTLCLELVLISARSDS